MKRIYFILLLLSNVVLFSCTGNKPVSSQIDEEEENVNDSTIYGLCGSGTMMHTLELVTNMEDTLYVNIVDDEYGDGTSLQGGLFSGDRMAVTLHKVDGELVADKILNLTTLLGKWTSIEKAFEITDGGEVHSSVAMETKSWTEWRILNGQLLLNRDTFDIVGLGGDSLMLENKEGIFYYKRVMVEKTDAEL